MPNSTENVGSAEFGLCGGDPVVLVSQCGDFASSGATSWFSCIGLVLPPPHLVRDKHCSPLEPDRDDVLRCELPKTRPIVDLQGKDLTSSTCGGGPRRRRVMTWLPRERLVGPLEARLPAATINMHVLDAVDQIMSEVPLTLMQVHVRSAFATVVAMNRILSSCYTNRENRRGQQGNKLVARSCRRQGCGRG